MTLTPRTPLDAALKYHALGWPVIPIGPDKRPLCEWGRWLSHTQSKDEVEGLFSQPAHGLALLTWPASDLVVLDFDGPHAVKVWEAQTSTVPPSTAKTLTRSGGTHLIYRTPDQDQSLRRQVRVVTDEKCGCEKPCGVDILVNGYLIVPPTPGYRESPNYPLRPTQVAVIPPEVLALARAGDNRSSSQVSMPTGDGRIPEGQRNVALTRLAGAMRRQGASEETMLAVLRHENASRCDPPLADREVQRIAHSAARYDPAPVDTPCPVLVSLAEVEPEPVSWLWPGRVPRGKLTLIAGDPGLGKSFLLVDLAARVSAELPWPDGGKAPHGKVILLTAEDGLADTVRPRLDAMGGDPSSVVVLTSVVREKGEPKAFSLARDIQLLEDAVVETGAVLVGIDPLSAYLGDADSFRDSDIRSLLAPLAALAERKDVAVVSVMHLSKDSQRKAMYRTQGSMAFVAASRAVFLVVEDQGNPTRRLFLPLKLNIAAQPPGLAFTLPDDAKRGTRVVWGKCPVRIDIETALTSPSPEERTERQIAQDFLRDLLADGPVLSNQVIRQARENGIAERTLIRAKEDLGVKSDHEGSPGKWQRWYWKLPETPGDVASLGEDSATNSAISLGSPRMPILKK